MGIFGLSERVVPGKKVQLALSECRAGPLTEEILDDWQIAGYVVSTGLLLTPAKAESECLQLLPLQSIADVVIFEQIMLVATTSPQTDRHAQMP